MNILRFLISCLCVKELKIFIIHDHVCRVLLFGFGFDFVKNILWERARFLTAFGH